MDTRFGPGRQAGERGEDRFALKSEGGVQAAVGIEPNQERGADSRLSHHGGSYHHEDFAVRLDDHPGNMGRIGNHWEWVYDLAAGAEGGVQAAVLVQPEHADGVPEIPKTTDDNELVVRLGGEGGQGTADRLGKGSADHAAGTEGVVQATVGLVALQDEVRDASVGRIDGPAAHDDNLAMLAQGNSPNSLGPALDGSDNLAAAAEAGVQSAVGFVPSNGDARYGVSGAGCGAGEGIAGGHDLPNRIQGHGNNSGGMVASELGKDLAAGTEGFVQAAADGVSGERERLQSRVAIVGQAGRHDLAVALDYDAVGDASAAGADSRGHLAAGAERRVEAAIRVEARQGDRRKRIAQAVLARVRETGGNDPALDIDCQRTHAGGAGAAKVCEHLATGAEGRDQTGGG
jgi:hypothetical protein